MITKEEYMEIKILSEKQGKSIRKIARITGHSRNTIRKFLRSAAEPRYKQREKRAGKLDPEGTSKSSIAAPIASARAGTRDQEPGF